jgi:hypothetical protein
MTAGEDGNEGSFDDLVVADDDFADLFAQGLPGLAERLDPGFGAHAATSLQERAKLNILF